MLEGGDGMTDNQIREEAYRLFYALNPELLPYHFPEDYPLDGERTGEGGKNECQCQEK